MSPQLSLLTSAHGEKPCFILHHYRYWFLRVVALIIAVSQQAPCVCPHGVLCSQTLFIAQIPPYTHVLYLSLARLPSFLSLYLAESPWLSHLFSWVSEFYQTKRHPTLPHPTATQSHGSTWRSSLQSLGCLSMCV